MDSSSWFDDQPRRSVLQSIGGTFAALGLSTSVSHTATAATSQSGFGPKLIEHTDATEFQFPYFLYAPPDTRDTSLLVEPVNSSRQSDDMEFHISEAESLVSYGLGRTISDTLNIAFLVPVIKDPESGVAGDARPQSLDTSTMNIASGRYARIDRQVVTMVDHARDKLSDAGYDIPPEFLMNGFSETGNFGNNLAVLQPERVATVTAGGMNGMATLPDSEINGESVAYQIGVGDIAELTESEFDMSAWKNVSQLCYMGANERGPRDDTLPYDMWNPAQTQRAIDVYGREMQRERMVYSDAVYQRADADVRFEVYDNVGHDDSLPEIGRDVLNFHRQNLQIPYVSLIRGQTAGSDSLTLEAYVPADSGSTFDVRVFVNGSDWSENPATIRANSSNRITLPLTSSLELGDTIEIAICDPAQPTLADAVYSDQRQVVVDVDLIAPDPGDTSIDIEYEVGESRIQFHLLTDSGALYWQRRTRVDPIGPNASGTETVDFTQSDEGLPFEADDELRLQARTPDQPRGLQSTLDSVTVTAAGGYNSKTHCLGSISHDSVDIQFTAPPLVNGDSISVAYDVDASFDRSIQHLKLFSDTGSGRSGIAADWDLEDGWTSFDRNIAPGSSASTEYNVPDITFAPADTPALGERVEIRAYPEGWASYDDFVASDCVPISGVRFTNSPAVDRNSVPVKFCYPGLFDEPGQLQLIVDNEIVDTVSGISPATVDSHTFSLDTTVNLTQDTDVAVSIGPKPDDPFHKTQTTVRPAAAGAVSFEQLPSALDNQLDLAYHLDADVLTEQFATLRLYTPETSAWGVSLGRINPGTDTTEQHSVAQHEPCVPFQPGTEVTVKLVDRNDPYGIQPFATATTVVGQQIKGVTQEQFDAALPDGANTTLGQLRAGVADWSDNNKIDGVSFTLEELRRTVSWWASQ